MLQRSGHVKVIEKLLAWCRCTGRPRCHLPESQVLDIGRNYPLVTHNVFKRWALLIESIFLTVLVSIAHQRLADTLTYGVKDEPPL